MLPRPPSALALAAIAALAAAPARAQSPASPADGRRGDIERFRTEFLARDRSYAPAARAEAESRLARLAAQAGEVSAAYFELELARIVALADNGHTVSQPARRSVRYDRVPLRFVPLGERFYVLRADTAHADLLGAELVAIDGHPAADLVATSRTLSGGTPAWRDRNAGFFFESPEQLHALGMAERAGGATYRLRTADGRTVERRIAAEGPDSARDRYNAGRWLFAEPLPTDQGGWRSLVEPGRAPWAFQAVSEPFRWRADPDLDALVVLLDANRDTAGHGIGDFLRAVTAEIRARRPRNIVLDMRLNGGGDLNTTRDFAQSLPALVPGRIVVLTSPWTFSAGISTIGYLKQAGRERVTIVGEPVGDRLQMWAEGHGVVLPYSGAAAAYATERHDYLTGCRPFTDCHAPVVRHPISVPSLEPDVAAPLTIEALRAGRDPGMEAAAALLRR